MIIPMTKFSFILLSGEKEKFLEEIQELGVVDITRSSKPVDEVSMRIMADIERTQDEINDIKTGTCAELESLASRKAELSKELKKVAPWGDYDKKRLSSLPIRFFNASRKVFDESWTRDYALQVISEDGDRVWFVIAGPAEGFPLKDMPAPERTLSEVRADIEEVDRKTKVCAGELGNRKKDIPELEKRIKKLYSKLNLYLAGISGETAAEDSLLVLQGFAPAEEDAKLTGAFDKMGIFYIKEEASAEDNPPIELRNNRFVRQFEPLTRMYGMPVYNEFDPTIFLSFFFLLFFAMCMGDAGYGIILVIIGLLLRGKEGGFAKMWSLIVTLGAGTFIVGIVMGGFFGIDLSSQAWVPEWLKKCMITGDISLGGGTYAKQMVLSLLIGVGHICLAMVVKAVWSVRRDGFKHSLGTLGWTLLIVGGIAGLAIGLTGIISETAMKWLLIGTASVSALGIYLFNRWGRNPLANIGSGLWDTYNMVSGLMGDVLSYIRLYALGLSGSMLGQTFNQIAEMVKGPDPTWQWAPFILIILIGHALNIAMSGLGAFVHPLRLNFVEFFKNSGYEGQGVSYNPIRK